MVSRAAAGSLRRADLLAERAGAARRAPFDGSGRHDTDLYIENFKAVSLDEEGRVRQSITARVARHYPDDDTTEFDRR